jgi:hypothetical protein
MQADLPAWAADFIEQDQEGLTDEHRLAALVRIGELASDGSQWRSMM